MAPMRRRAGRWTPAGLASLWNLNKVIFLQIRTWMIVLVLMIIALVQFDLCSDQICAACSQIMAVSLLSSWVDWRSCFRSRDTLQIIITHLIAHAAHHRCSIQTSILRYNSVFLRTFCVPFSHSNIFTLGTSLPIMTSQRTPLFKITITVMRH